MAVGGCGERRVAARRALCRRDTERRGTGQDDRGGSRCCRGELADRAGACLTVRACVFNRRGRHMSVNRRQ